ncbi:MAG: mycothiol synthase [Acidimicrobiales bacterium]
MTITSSQLDGGEFAVSLSVSPDHPRATLAADLSASISKVPALLDGTRSVQVWLEGVREGDDDLVSHEVLPYRNLLHMRRSLPAGPSGITTRGFDVACDADNLISVNNRAFYWHPEQSGYTRARLDTAMTQRWFDPDGLRVLELEGRMAGFCWAKIHVDHDPPLGEIYVIALDPDFQGRGLGGPMTLAGLEWLSAQRVTVSGLYVESDNHAAIRTYHRLGFTVHSTNRAYAATGPAMAMGDQ